MYTTHGQQRSIIVHASTMDFHWKLSGLPSITPVLTLQQIDQRISGYIIYSQYLPEVPAWDHLKLLQDSIALRCSRKETQEQRSQRHASYCTRTTRFTTTVSYVSDNFNLIAFVYGGLGICAIVFGRGYPPLSAKRVFRPLS